MAKTTHPEESDKWAANAEEKTRTILEELSSAHNLAGLRVQPDDWHVHLNLQNNFQFDEAIKLVERWGMDVYSFALTNASGLWLDFEVRFKNDDVADECRAWLKSKKLKRNF